MSHKTYFSELSFELSKQKNPLNRGIFFADPPTAELSYKHWSTTLFWAYSKEKKTAGWPLMNYRSLHLVGRGNWATGMDERG